MPYRFRRKDRSVEKAVRRIARAQIGNAITIIDGGANPDRTVHEVRRCCKRLRALVRLVRPAFSDFDVENVAFRDIARSISGTRDRTVMHNTIARLTKRFPARLEQGAAALLDQALDLMAGEGAGQFDPRPRLAQCRNALMLADERALRWKLDADGWAAISPGLVKTYRLARKVIAELDHDEDGQCHHRLRRWMKYHYHHCQLLRPIGPSGMKAREKQAERLSNMLGNHHDLTVLERKLVAIPEGFDLTAEIKMAASVARRERMRIEQRLPPLLDDLLSEKPSALDRQLGELWSNWRDRT